jgi:tetratricopeptide (TPR) repeat protein
MEQLDPGSVASETRLAHLAVLKGDAAGARKRYLAALAQAKSALTPSVETIAWCYWQLGELSKATGQFDAAQRSYNDALKTFPNYPHAFASLAQLTAAQGDLNKGIEMIETLLRKHPDPIDAAALGDLYSLGGRGSDAAAQYATVERLCQQDPLYSALYNRHLVMFWADHDIKVAEAYERARKEYETRRDIYAADAMAWAALKAGRLDEAQVAIKDAQRLGSEDARIFYHAGMIARAVGDRPGAENFLKRALEVNKYFDPLQSKLAANALTETRSTK